MFNPCIVIPLYNHGATLRHVVAQLVPINVPIIVVDDGSELATREVLQNLLVEYQSTVADIHAQRLQAVFLPKNGGKGAAVLAGFRSAWAQGYTHALQVDADGQHDLRDVPRFLQAAARYPTALVCGKPVYDHTAPATRKYGRLVTHFWVHVETLSLAIGDSMCGFRMYPLHAALQVADKIHLPLRMAFDIAIIVRMYWLGLPVLNLRTRVIYPEQGISHFDVWRDNLRISATHTRLVFGMLLRLPLLCLRKLTQPSQTLRDSL